VGFRVCGGGRGAHVTELPKDLAVNAGNGAAECRRAVGHRRSGPLSRWRGTRSRAWWRSGAVFGQRHEEWLCALWRAAGK
jgi:hypothetical protein